NSAGSRSRNGTPPGSKQSWSLMLPCSRDARRRANAEVRRRHTCQLAAAIQRPTAVVRAGSARAAVASPHLARRFPAHEGGGGIHDEASAQQLATDEHAKYHLIA